MTLQEHLRSTGTSVHDFATEIGVSDMAVRQWLWRKRVPRPSIMKRIAQATGGAVLPNDFLDDEVAA